MKQIPLSVPNLDLEIVENLKECIETGWVSTGGRFIDIFEKKMAQYTGMNDAVSCQSGTAGLHVSLQILGVKSEDEVIVPTLSFIAAVNPVKYLGAEPIFMDCDDSLCMDAEKLAKFCKEECTLKNDCLINNKTGKKVSAIIVVHIFGNLANMEQIMKIAETYHLKVLEDATEALGSYYTDGIYKGKYSGTIGHMGVYSFNANKIITTGGGGMIVSNNQEYLDKARYLTITAKENNPEEVFYFVHNEVGYNYRMLNLQAALGVSQIDQLESFIKVKKDNYEKYKELLKDTRGISVLPFKEGLRPNYWFYSLFIHSEEFGEDRDALMKRLIDRGIQCRPIWKLIHTQRPYIQAQSYKIEKAIEYVRHILNVPCSSNLGFEDVQIVCNMIGKK